MIILEETQLFQQYCVDRWPVLDAPSHEPFRFRYSHLLDWLTLSEIENWILIILINYASPFSLFQQLINK